MHRYKNFQFQKLSTYIKYSVLVFVICSYFVRANVVEAAATGTIVSSPALVWSDQLGWINFNPSQGNVVVTDEGLSGFVWSQNYGWINLSPTNGGVRNDGQGHLTGYAWGEQVGWIIFDGVTIDSQGLFSGSAHGLRVGTLNFSCVGCAVTSTWQAPVSALPSNPGSAPSIPLTVTVTGFVTAQSRELVLKLYSAEAKKIRLGWSFDTLFKPWQPFLSDMTLSVPEYAIHNNTVTIFIQVEDVDGRVSLLTPFTFYTGVTQEQESVILTPSTVLESALTSSLPLGFSAGIFAGLQLGCVPFLASTLPTPALRQSESLEIKKLQLFLQSFLRKKEISFPQSGVYDGITRRYVSEFQELFAPEILAPEALRKGTGVVGPRTRLKINDIACRARIYEITREFLR